MSPFATVSHSLRSCTGAAGWVQRPVSAWHSPIASARSYCASRLSACPPNLQLGQSRLVITEAKDVLQVQDEYGEVMCRLGTVDDDACDICEKAVANTPILYIQKAQDDSWYDDVSCTLCKPCMLAMFKVFEDKLDNRK